MVFFLLSPVQLSPLSLVPPQLTCGSKKRSLASELAALCVNKLSCLLESPSFFCCLRLKNVLDAQSGPTAVVVSIGSPDTILLSLNSPHAVLLRLNSPHAVLLSLNSPHAVLLSLNSP